MEQELALTAVLAEMLRAARLEGEEPVDLCAEQDLGEGVRLVSAEPIEEAERVGCRQVYAFADINTLRLKPDLDEVFPEGMGDEDEAPSAPDEPITFTFRPGSPATLVVHMPEQEMGKGEDDDGDESSEASEAEEAAGRAMALALMREMLRDSRFSVHLVPGREIVETDAAHRDGGRITLIELDFDKLLEDGKSLERIFDLEGASSEEATALLAELPGVRVETREDVTVRFR